MEKATENRKAKADTDAKKFALRFWTAFDTYVFDGENGFSSRFHRNIPPTYSVYRLSHGMQGIHTNLCFDTKRRMCITRFCMLGKPRTIENSNALFDNLAKYKDEIEYAYGHKLIWRKAESQESSFVEDEISFNPDDSDDWDKAFDWYMQSAVKIQKIIVERFVGNDGNVTRDINIPMRPESIENRNGRIEVTCGRCHHSFIHAPRCPECGQLVAY